MTIPTRVGPYLIRSKLGEGAVGVVYLADHETSGMPAALKVLRHPVADIGVEVAAAERLHHPNIVELYEAGEDGGADYMAMEYVEGPTLKDLLDRHAPVMLEWIEQLLDALAYAHDQGVAHGDIKPANLLIGPYGRLKVADFGLASIDGDPGAETVPAAGTPHYMAPERLRGGAPDAAGDIFAVGVILYRMLTGARPFQGTPFEVVQQILHDDPIDPSTRSPLVNVAFDAVIRSALAKTPGARYPDARTLRDAFADACRQ